MSVPVQEDGSKLGLAFSPDGKTLASWSGNRTIRFWATASGQERPPLLGLTQGDFDVVFAPDGRTVAAWQGKQILLWDVSQE